ncbi:MAG: hypothetical protein JW719_02400 [Pirellulales bacterium]|nr:hypothetical protein [Pirellulales bacterium]
MARLYDSRAVQSPVRFDSTHQRILIWILYDACLRRKWRLHYVATETTHVHILVSWREFTPWQEVGARLKNLMSLMLGKKLDVAGRTWFSRKGSRKRVEDRRHFDYLVRRYLPSHRGLCWREGDLAPEEPFVAGERGEG